MVSKKYRLYLAGLIVALTALALRASNFQFFLRTETGHFSFFDTDCYYQLRRLVYFLENFPRVLVFDPLTDWPYGGSVDWPEGFHLLIGIPLKLMGVDSFQGLEIGACILMLFLGLIAIAAIVWASTFLLRENVDRLFVALFAACNFLLIRFSCLGQVDHHILEATFPPLLFGLGCLRSTSKRYPCDFLAAGLLMFFSLTVSSSSLFSIGAFFLSFVFVHGRAEDLKPFWFWMIIPLLGLLAAYTYWNHQARGVWTGLGQPGVFHLGLVLLLSLVTSLTLKFQITQKSMGIFGIVMASLCVTHILNIAPFLTSPFAQAIEYVFGKGWVLGNVGEASSIFSHFGEISFDYVIGNFTYLFFLVPIAVFGWFEWKNLSVNQKAFLIWLTVMSIPGVVQKRFAHMWLGFVLIYYVIALRYIVEKMKEKQLRLGTAFQALWLGLMIFPLIGAGFAPLGGVRDSVDGGIVRMLKEHANLKTDEAWDRLALKTKSDEAVWANPNIGHMLLYTTGHPVMTNTYYHGDPLNLDFELRTMKFSDEFVNRLRELKFKYAIVADDFRYMELQARIRGVPTQSWVKIESFAQGDRMTFELPVLRQWAWVRLVTDDDEVDGLKRLFTAKTNENYYYNYIRGYEILPSK